MDQILKIVHIITRLILGGAQENTILTCRELSARGHDVILITGPAIGPEGSLFGHTENMGFEVVRLERLIRAIRPINDYLAYCELKMLLGKLDPDIIHTHSAKAGIVGRFAGHPSISQWEQLSGVRCGWIQKYPMPGKITQLRIRITARAASFA